MVRGRRRGRIVDAKDEGSPGPCKKSSGAASNSSEDPLVAMDPGPGDTLISLTASVDRRPASRISKRALASRSLFFKTALQPHFNQRQGSAEIQLTVSSEMVTEEAWQVLLPHLATGVAIKLDLENVFDVLRAANFLQMDEAEVVITDFIKAHISKTDFLDAYNFARQAKIDGLANTIRTTLVQPEEYVRRRLYGNFDSTIQLGSLSYRCHKAVLIPAIARLGEHLGKGDGVVDVQVLGVTEGHMQHLYTLLEAVYVGNYSSLICSSLEDTLAYYTLIVQLNFTSTELKQMILQELSKLVNIANLATVSANSLLPGHHALRNLYLLFLVRHPDVLEKEVVHLTRREVEAVLCSDWLEHEGGEVAIAELALAWLKHGRQGEDGLLAKCVRWSQLRPGEVDGVMAKLTPRWVEEVNRECSKGLLGKARGWPRLLVLVECPNNWSSREGERIHQLKVHAYDFEAKSWELMTKVPVSVKEGWKQGYSVSCMSESLVISSSNSSQPFLPVACQTYCVSSNKWSEPPPLATSSPRDWLNEEEHMTAALGNELFTVLTRKRKSSGEMLVLHHGTPGGPWTTAPCPAPVPCWPPRGVLAVGGSIVVVLPTTGDKSSVNLVSFNPMLQDQPQAGKKPLQSKRIKHLHSTDISWSTFNGKLVCVAGGGQGREVITWGLEGGEGEALGKLRYRRRAPGVGTCKGKLWVAGGVKYFPADCEDYDYPVIECAVESYDDVVDSWVSLPHSPQLESPSVEMLELRKPLRMMNTSLLSMVEDIEASQAGL